jgi:hypothetical protein
MRIGVVTTWTWPDARHRLGHLTRMDDDLDASAHCVCTLPQHAVHVDVATNDGQ